MSHDEFPTETPAVVTCGLPYANGDLHIGHMRTYVSGDVMARSLRAMGQDTALVSGSDMHGTPVAVNAWEEGIPPEEFALQWHEQYEATFPRLNIDFDNYGHTHDQTNTELTKEIVRALDEAGYIYEEAIKVAWDPEEDQSLPDRYVRGTCPYCGAQARGDECDEGCQRHLEPGEIENPESIITGNPAEYRERVHKFFRISDLQEYLQEFIERLEGTSNAQNQPREWIEGELQDWCITRDLDWGIDYPGEDGHDLVLYVWVDAPIEYIASTKQYSEGVGAEVFDWEDPWKANGEIIHVIGRDIIQHHTVFWPSMLYVAGYNEPRAIMASGFMSLDGDAFSTSRNRAIWVDEFLDEGFHPDLLRYYITTAGSFQDDIDFSWDRFQEVVNGELVGNVGNFIYRSLLFAHRNWDGTPPAEVSAEVRDRIQDAVARFEAGINDYSIRDAAEAGVRLAGFGNEYIQQNEPWKLIDDAQDEAAQVIRDCVQIAKAVTILLAPTLPEITENVWSTLDESGSVHDVGLTGVLSAPPDEFGAPREPFTAIEDDRVDELNEQLQARIAEAGDEDAPEADTADGHGEYEPLSTERVSFEEFQKLDIRVAEILSVDTINGADELVRLEVDIGPETRQLVAGIKQLHELDELPGKRIIVLANLEKAELFGVESNGMLLAAGEQADLLTTYGDAEPGEEVQ